MKKTHAQKLIVVGVAGVAAGVSTLTLSSTGVAVASPDMSGKTYSEAQAALSSMGYTAVATTVFGDKSAQANCKVLRQQDFPTSNIFVGGDQPTLYPIKLPNVPTAGQVFLTLACYNAKDSAAGQATGSGDINTKPGS
jgi:hypothetical protein